jgi:hypothetical protein
LEDAYAIQHALIAEREAEGHEVVGVKMGFTSVAKMKQMGVDDMIIGQLTSDMFISTEQPLQRSQCIHPRAEPEIAFRLSQDVTVPCRWTRSWAMSMAWPRRWKSLIRATKTSNSLWRMWWRTIAALAGTRWALGARFPRVEWFGYGPIL